MLSYQLRTNFEHIKGDSWEPLFFNYSESFLEEVVVDYQLNEALDVTLIPRNDQDQGLTFDPTFARNYPELRGYDFDPTSIS